MFQGGFGTGSANTFGTFNKPTTGFGTTAAPVFGNTGGSLFGAAQPATNSLFGVTNPAPAFGQPQTTTSFGGFSSGTGTGLFGNNQNASTSSGLFGSTNTSAFGQAKPAFGGFGTTQTTGGLFGQQTTAQPQPATGGLFGQPAAATSTTGLFGAATGGFGAGGVVGAGATGTGTAKFVAITGNDTMVKNGVSQTISTRHHCITCMKEYEGKSLEELRMEDYSANRKGPQQGVQPSGGLFGAAQQPSLFGNANTTPGQSTGLFGAPPENKSLFGSAVQPITGGFGQMNSAFGSTGNSLFGKPTTAAPAFGTATISNTFGFNTPTNTTNPFGSNINPVKPFGSTQPNLFGAPTSQPAAGFGTTTPAFGAGAFGATPAPQPGGLFAKPAFGGGQSSFTFGQTPATSGQGSSLFGAKPPGTGFGSPFGTTPAPGTGTAFGTAPSLGATNQNNSLFGNTTFKPPASNFSFGPAPNTSTAFGGGSSLFGNTANKTPSLFGNTNPGTGLFSSGFGSTTNTQFGAGSNPSMLGMGMPMGSLLGGSTFSTGAPAQPTVNLLNQQMMALSSMPFGDNPLFKSLLPSSGKVDELLKPVPAANQKNLLNGQNYKVSANNATKIKMKPIGSITVAKMSLFEGLEDDPNYFQKMQMKPTIKRLNIQPKNSRSPGANRANPDLPSGLLLQPDSFAGDNNSPRYFTPLDSLSSTSPSSDAKVNTSKADQTTTPSAKTTPAADKTDGSNTMSMGTLLQTPDNTITELASGKPATSAATTSSAADAANENKENAEQSSSSNSSESEACAFEPGLDEPHLSGIVLRRVGYYTIPSMDALANLVDPEGRCFVDNFTVGRYNYGNIFFPDSFDVSGLNLDEIVHFRHKEVTVYPDEGAKPAISCGLNRAAQVTLDRVWPVDKITRQLISEPTQLDEMDYEQTLRQACAKMGARFKEYRPATGSWVFKVDHFSKYGLSDSDEEDSSATDIKKLRLNTAPPNVFPPGPKELGLKRGLDGRWGPPPPPQGPPTSASLLGLGLDEDDQDMDDQTPFSLDDDNFQSSQLSPTMQMAKQMGASSRKVQLMKASFYNDDADDYPINGDVVDFRLGSGVLDVEEFDQGPKLHKSFPVFRTQFNKYDEGPTAMSFLPREVMETDSSGVSVAPLLPVVPAVPPLPPVKPQHRTLKYPDGAVVAYSQSLAARPDVEARSAVDLGLFRGRSFRVGWSRDLSLASLSTRAVAATVEWTAPMDRLGSLLSGRPTGDTTAQIVQRVRLTPGAAAPDDDAALDFKMSVEEHLETALAHSLWSEGACPRVGPRAGVAALHAHCAIAQQMAVSYTRTFTLSACQVWELCVALWGQLPDLNSHDSPQSHLSVMARRAAVSDWLESVVREATRSDLSQNASEPANVFTLLTGHCVLEACSRALDAGDHYTGLLLSGAPDAGPMLEQQLEQWVETEADQLIDPHRLKQTMLAAGVPVLRGSRRTINVCQGLDWRRAFAIHLWYICSPVASVTDALLRYEAAFSEEGMEPYADPPLPPHCPEWESSRPVYDVCYHLLKLFSSRAHPLAPILNPATHTADPLDYRLSWLLLRTVESLGYSHVSALCAANVHTAFAAQLEAHGLWHWAVFALLHIADASARAKAVQDVLGRHIDLETDPEKERLLIDQLRVPAQWVYQAKATYAAAHFQFKEAAEFLLMAEEWNEAHKVIVEHISAKCIINEHYDYLSGLLRRLDPHQGLISGWGHQGALLVDYLSVVDEVAGLVNRQDPAVGYQLERLQPKLASLCGRIHQLPTPTALHRLCQAEIAKRAVHLIRTLLIVQRGDSSSQSLGMSTNVLAHLVNQLPLPEDYSKQELQELTSTLVSSVAR